MINIQTSIEFLYIINEHIDIKIKNVTSKLIFNHSKKWKDLGVNLTKHALDLWAENYITLTKEIQKVNGETYYVHRCASLKLV